MTPTPAAASRHRRFRLWALLLLPLFAAFGVFFATRGRTAQALASPPRAIAAPVPAPPPKPLVVASSSGRPATDLAKSGAPAMTRLLQSLLTVADGRTYAYPASEADFLTRARLKSDDLTLSLATGATTRLRYLPGSKQTSPPNTVVFLSDALQPSGARLALLNDGSLLQLTAEEYTRALTEAEAEPDSR